MMEVSWTREQQQVIDLRDRDILVSAAAGSGKTAVLVERILSMIAAPDSPINIDQLLIVTFTRAAAGEMRERLGKAIELRLAAEPDNEHLQKQSTLIHHAQITTIDGFCSHVIRNYFHMIDLDPGFRTGEEGELKLLKSDVAKILLEDAYKEGKPEFHEFIECYAAGKTDEGIIELVLRLYEFSMSYPFPEKWLESCRSAYEADTQKELMDSPWMQLLWEDTERRLRDARELTEENLRLCGEPGGPYLYEEAIQSDLSLIKGLEAKRDFGQMAAVLKKPSFARLSGKKDANISENLKARVKSCRDQVKDILKDLGSRYFYGTLEDMLEVMKNCRRPVGALIDLTLEFMERYRDKKREKNMVDFADMEHFALEILADMGEGGPKPSQAAIDFQNRYAEILIDEYQDSNLVQEMLLNQVSGKSRGRHNIFMVGDVKQSIYRFRLARPELFMEKFHTYSREDSSQQRIDLHKNFRSRAEVLDGANFIFSQIMGEGLGKVEYDQEAALYPGAVFPETDREAFAPAEVLLIEKDTEEMEEEHGSKTAQELEALAVSERIREIAGREQVLDKASGEYRPARYGDMVILLRTVTGWAEVFTKVLTGQGIPAYSTSKTGYFSALEVVTVLNYLHICDNPCQDIPFAAVLHSPIVGCTAGEMAQIGAEMPGMSIDRAAVAYAERGGDEGLKEKLKAFLEQLAAMRKRVPYTPIHQLILGILEETGYGNYVKALPYGEQRSANLGMLVEKAMDFETTSYRGLFNFIRYIENLQKYHVDFGEVNVMGGGEDMVRIMSIHKSKGLEFPIVFVSGMGKSFNFQDANAGLLLHPELGLGADSIYPKERIRCTTLMKQVIRQQTIGESLGEELRVLYVALTRAKEKLLLTGTVSKLEKRVLACQAMSGRSQRKLPYGTLEKARDYWGWILLALSRHRAFAPLYERYGLDCCPPPEFSQDQSKFCIRVVTPGEMLGEQTQLQGKRVLDRESLLSWDPDQVFEPKLRREIQERFSYVYPHKNLEDLPVKMTVSELKKQGMQEEESYQPYFEPDVVPLIPGFIQEREETYQGAARGTAYHRVLECLDFTKVSREEEILEQMRGLLEEEKLQDLAFRTISAAHIQGLCASPLGQRMAAAAQKGKLFREQPFVIEAAAPSGEDTILVQGIIDAYFYEEDGIVLVDYKTDRLHPGEEQTLTEKYRPQLEYYGDALCRLTGKPVKEKIIYSFALGQGILVR